MSAGAWVAIGIAAILWMLALWVTIRTTAILFALIFEWLSDS